MQAFHNQEEIKLKYVTRVQRHRELDNLIQGKTWQNGKGCAIGCTLENYDHHQYEVELGIPEWLARVEDKIFEGLEKKEAILWPERFLSAIKPGVDLEKIKIPFLIFLVESTLTTFDHKKYPKVLKANKGVIKALKTGKGLKKARAAAADAAAADAAYAAAAYAAAADAADAAYAAFAAAYAAAAADAYAAYAAAAAAYAAYAAAAAAYAADAAYAAARQNRYKMFADKLLELIESLSKEGIKRGKQLPERQEGGT